VTREADTGLPEVVDESFLGVLAHELRTPATTIYAGARLLSNPRLPATTRRAMTIDLVAESERLYRVVEDLLILGRLDVGGLQADHIPVAIGQTAIEAIEREVALSGDLRITYSGSRDLVADTADPSLVMHVVRNLLDNAVRASRPHALVEVVVEGSTDEVAMRVLDEAAFSGRGGPDAFEIVASPPATTAQRSGAGLGLVVVRRLVAAMDGRVWARPRPAGGNEFGFALPRSRA
jgi:K+-sensing histidine kinase KdpD